LFSVGLACCIDDDTEEEKVKMQLMQAMYSWQLFYHDLLCMLSLGNPSLVSAAAMFSL